MTEPGKRLIIACDGTWQNSDNGFEKDGIFPWDTNGHLQVPTNVTRICRSILSRTSNGKPQIVYYQAGVGTGDSAWDHVVGGGTGAGMSEHIREAYAFLCNNYESGDEIIILGFSRGAFTARSIGGIIATIGLLTKRGLIDFYAIFKDWENQIKPGFVPQWKGNPTPKNRPITGPEYVNELGKLGLSRLNIPVKAVGVWDTVGSLGIPNIGILPVSTPEYSFIDTAVAANVEFAFHALALEERRKPFSPTIWEKPVGQSKPTILKQCWFPGVHSNIGGSYEDTETADITLAWMMAQLHENRCVEFDSAYITWQRELNMQYYKSQKADIRPWSCGKLYNSMVGITKLAGSQIRTPGQYHASDPNTGKPTNRRLQQTNEFVHPCVRVRKALNGKGEEDVGKYDPPALKDFKFLKPGEQVASKAGAPSDPLDGQYRYELRLRDGSVVVLPEDTMAGLELTLLATSPEAQRLV